MVAVGRGSEPLNETRGRFARIVRLALDVTADDAPRRVVEAAGERLDVLVNNATIVGSGLMGEITKIEMFARFDTNVFASVLLTRAALPMLEVADGVVVNISTGIGQRAWPESRP
ncbi:MAG TPA: SDR family NAD(P)-dependent oxidoreductase [Candidatus Stackebrandtia excrementipullorum]|nr:SDR family NAD(P)-dependent oxidoreductase [Candidatus Stackebrandtia excrementipullorum]